VRVNVVLMLVSIVVALPHVITADQVTLSTGELLRGKVTAQDGQSVTLEHPVLGTLKIAKSDVTGLAIDGSAPPPPAGDTTPPSGGAPATPPVTGTPPAAEPAPPPPPDSILEGWKSQFEVSFSGQQGNSETTALRVAFLTERKAPEMILKFDASTYLETNEGDTTTEETTVGGRGEWPFEGTKWFAFAQGRFDYDRFEAWDYRVTGAGGMGYYFIRNDDLTFSGRLGAGFAKEFGDQADEPPTEALAGLAVDWKINSRLHLTAETTYHPDISDPMQFRLVSEAALAVDLNKDKTFKFKFGIQDEYESQTEDDSKHNDLRYFGALVLTF